MSSKCTGARKKTNEASGASNTNGHGSDSDDTPSGHRPSTGSSSARRIDDIFQVSENCCGRKRSCRKVIMNSVMCDCLAFCLFPHMDLFKLIHLGHHPYHMETHANHPTHTTPPPQDLFKLVHFGSGQLAFD